MKTKNMIDLKQASAAYQSDDDQKYDHATSMLSFNTESPSVILDVHLQNLINTYGKKEVSLAVRQLIKIETKIKKVG